MPSQIVVTRGPLVGRSFPLNDAPLSFGRTPENAVVIASALASRRHAEIRYEGGAYVLYDLGSSNGTTLGGQRVQRQPLQPGDQFEIGDEAFRFETTAAVDRTIVVPPAAPAPTVPVAGANPPPLPNYGQSPLPPLPQAGALPPLPQANALPPLPQSGAVPPLPQAGVLPPPPAPAQPRGRSRLPIILAVVLLLGCVLAAGLAGGVYLLTRSGAVSGSSDSPTGNPVSNSTAGPAPTREPVAGDAADWTVLIYLDGDNNLEADALEDFREMAEVGSSDKLKIAVQLDRISSSEFWDDDSAGDWDGAARFLVERGSEPELDAAVEDLGEVNMGDPSTLADFIDWGVQTYPAQRYALVIWDHGASWLGIASDDTDDGDILSLPELSSALETARDRSGYGTFDLIGFDACLMAQLDVFKAVEPYGQVAVASAELEPSEGWAWDVWLGALADDSAQDGFAIAPVIVESYTESFEGSDADDVTLSAFDLAKLGLITEQLDALSGAMIGEMDSSFDAIGQARSFVNVYAPSYPEEFNAVDLGHFASLLPEQGATDGVIEAAEALESAIGQARIANGAGSYHRDSSGVSIYFPQVSELYIDLYEQGSPLPRATQWEEFLKGFYTAGDSAVIKPTISNVEVSASVASVNAPVNLTGTVSGGDIAYVFSFIGIANASRDTVDLLYVDFVYPPGATPSGDTPEWEEGDYDVRLDWDATNWYLSNGQDQIEVLLGPVKYGTNIYGVEGVYTSQASGEEINAGLIFEVSQGRGELVRVWGFPRTDGKQEPQPYELEPVAGDSFTAFTRSYTDNNGTLEPNSVEGQTITFGEQPLTASFGPTTSGEYVMGFLVRDIGGTFSYDFVDITVDNSGANNQPNQPAPPVQQGQPGTQAGYLAYSNPELGFSIEHPEAWTPYDSGRDKIIFYDAANDEGVYFSIDVYSLGLDGPEAANSEILRQLVELTQDTVEGEVRLEEEDFQAAGLDGRKVEYVYTNQNGGISYVVAVALTSPTSARTYLITIEAPEEQFDAQLEIFNTMLDTLVIE